MSSYGDRIRTLAEQARVARETFTTGADVPLDAVREGDGGGSARDVDAADAVDPETCARDVARDGLGPVVGLYVEARTAEEPVRFDEDDLALLHRATSDWLAVYARCYGVDIDPDVTVREAAEILVDTHDVTDVAALLTGVPAR